MNSNPTALLIFARSLPEELKHKPFLAQRSLGGALNQQVLALAQKTGLPVRVFNENLQQGANFGERFTHAMAHMFGLGYQNVIAIGNDCPQMGLVHLRKALQCVLANQACIGAAQDGGFYLLALSKHQFQPEAFLKLNWGRSTLFQEIRHQLTQSGSTLNTLETLSDLDGQADLYRLSLRHITPTRLRNLLAAIIATYQRIRFTETLTPLPQIVERLYNKGSPLGWY